MSDCIEWPGAKDKDGYGILKIAGRRWKVHRITWMQDNGHTDLLILHSCDNPSCYNIEHLREGTHSDNHRERDDKRRGVNSRKTHCPQGHPLSGDNLYVVPKTGIRHCRACDRERQAARRAERRAS